MSKSPPLPKYTDFAALQEALAASQRREQELADQLCEKTYLAVTREDALICLRERLDAAAELVKTWSVRADSITDMLRATDVRGCAKELTAALSPTDPPAGETK